RRITGRVACAPRTGGKATERAWNMEATSSTPSTELRRSRASGRCHYLPCPVLTIDQRARQVHEFPELSNRLLRQPGDEQLSRASIPGAGSCASQPRREREDLDDLEPAQGL